MWSVNLLTNIIFLSFVLFTIYRSVIYRKQITGHEAETKDTKKTYDDRVGSLLINSLYLATYLSCLFAWYKYNLNIWTLIIGFIVVAYSWKIRLTCFEQLSKSYGHEIKIFENHKLITTGIYAKMRHPMYARLMLDMIGVAIISNWYLTWIFAICLILVVVRRIKIEDKILVEKLGQVAIDYQKKS